MSNLLDKASVILTPTAYNNGEALCVKPSDGSGDFDFSRNSAATRVNAQGLVENVQILSSNLVQNGDFSEEGVQEVSNGSFSQEGVELLSQPVNLVTDCLPNGGGVIVDADTFETFGGSFDGIRKNNFLTIGKTYRLTIEGNTTSSGFNIGDTAASGNEYGSGFGTFYFTAVGNGSLWIRQNTSGTTNITTFSIREVGQDWLFAGGAELTEQGARINNTITGANAFIKQVNSNLTIGKSLVFQYDVVETNGKNLAIEQISGNLSLNTSTVGNNRKVYFEFDRADASLIIKRAAAATDVIITNISVKEVGMDWTLQSNWEIAENKAESNGSGLIYQTSVSYIDGKNYKVTFDADITSGSGTVRLGNTTTPTSFANGSNEFYLQTDASNTTRYIFFQGISLVGSITNISVIEITDDTNLPRINYEGFSYQDALGSEQIVNGSFDDGSNWTTLGGWSIGGGSANCNGGSIMYTNGGIEVSKTYKVTYTIINYVSGNVRSIFNGTTTDGNGTTRNANGTYTENVQSTDNASGTFSFGAVAGSFVGSIDNVSVKEYLGQEVVPNSGCGSWLFEPQTTQLIPYSEDFSQYSSGGSPIISGGFLSPDGTNNAYKITNTGSSTLYLSGIPNLSSTSTRSIYARSVSGTGTASLMSYFGNTNNLFTLTEQWQRFEVNVTTTTTGENNFYAADFRGSGTLTEYLIWGANATNDQDYATSYIPSNGSQVTRNQDVCTNGGSLATINSTEGTLYFEGIYPKTTSGSGNKRIAISDGTSSNRVMFAEIGNTGLSALITSQGINSAYITGSLDNLSNFKAAISYKQNDFALWINGLKVATDTSGNVPIGLNEIAFDGGDGTNDFFGKTKALAVWKEALSDSELQSLTTI